AMFATVERSTAAICSNASFDVTQIYSQGYVEGCDTSCARSPFFKIAGGCAFRITLPVASIATNMNLSANRIRNRILQRPTIQRTWLPMIQRRQVSGESIGLA